MPKPSKQISIKSRPEANGETNRIAPGLKPLAVPLDSLTLDPDNARLHPERSIKVIQESLLKWGQMKPVVVRREGMIVIAGNGTVEAARKLGWTKIAANVVDVSEFDAVGYALADNKTAEESEWDYEVVARLSKMQEELGGEAVGWTADELAALRGEMPEQRWEDVWQGMPAYESEEMTAKVQLIVNLKSRDDLKRLLKLLGYAEGEWSRANSTRQRPSVWWPKVGTIKSGECKAS